jgi:hypothetical protein
MNVLGADILSLILQTLKPGGTGDALVITNDAEFFGWRQPHAAPHVRSSRYDGV